jgi:hypothetical protein
MDKKSRKVRFKGWSNGTRKIRFIMLLHEEGNLSLRFAKDIKDKVIGGEEIVEVEFDDIETAIKIFNQAQKIGVICEMID